LHFPGKQMLCLMPPRSKDPWCSICLGELWCFKTEPIRIFYLAGSSSDKCVQTPVSRTRSLALDCVLPTVLPGKPFPNNFWKPHSTKKLPSHSTNTKAGNLEASPTLIK
jgi:hypothetical protein